MGRLILALPLAGCLGSSPVDPSYPRVVLTDPVIEDSTLVCDVEAARWKLTLDASSWTGGATSAWTVDGEYVELHGFVQKSWAGDGSHERLELSLGIVDDWREADETHTVFTCAQDPSGVLQLRDREGQPADCRSWGPDPGIFAGISGTPTCDIPVDTQI